MDTEANNKWRFILVRKGINRRIVRFLFWCAVVFVALSLLVGVAVGLILTPERLTPIVEKYANEYLNAEVKMESVEGTFFSSYPRIGIRIHNGYIVSHKFHSDDTLSISRRDTLVEFTYLRASLSLHSMFEGKVCIDRLHATDAVIRLHTDSLGRSNWDITRDKTDIEQDTLLKTETGVSLDRIWLENSKFIYSDKRKKNFVKLGGLNLKASGNMDLKALSVDLELSDTTTTVKIDNVRYLRRLGIGVNGHIDYDITNDYYKFEDTKLTIGDVDLDLFGWLHLDRDTTRMDLSYALSTPSAHDLFGYLPSDLISAPVNIHSGNVSLAGSVKGSYGKDQMPVFTCSALVDSVKANYEGMPYDIEDFSAKFNLMADASRPDSSYANLDILHFKGGKTDVTAMVTIASLLDDPEVNCKVNAHVDLPTITEIFPISNTRMSGIVDADIDAHFRMSDIKDGQADKVMATGKLNVEKLKIVNDSADFVLEANANLKFDGRDTLGIRSKIDALQLKTKSIQVGVKDFRTRLKTYASRDTTVLPVVKDDVYVHRFFVKTDTVAFFGKNMRARTILTSMKENHSRPHMETDVRVDTIVGRIVGVRSITLGLHAKALLELPTDSTHINSGLIEFDEVRARAPQYALPVITSAACIRNNMNRISIEKTHVEVGATSADISGDIYNLYDAISNNKNIKASITFDADTIDYRQLVGAVINKRGITNDSATQIESSDTALVDMSVDDSHLGDTTINRLIVVPEGVDVKLTTKIGVAIYDDLKIRDINGDLFVANGSIHMTDLRFRQNASRAFSTMAYRAIPRKKVAYTNLFIRWRDVDINDIVTTVGLDTVMPMLKPLQGKVNCYLGAEAELDSMMNLNTHHVRMSLHIGAKNLVVFDNETFANISKMLMFKNKKVNRIDTVTFNVLIDTSHIEVLPFVLNIDRYKMVIGGAQDFDMNMKYHISVLKSPLPFKAGLTLQGRPGNLKYDVTKAKLKKYADSKVQLHNDTITTVQRREILRRTYRLSGQPLPERLKRKDWESNYLHYIRPKESELSADTIDEQAQTDTIALQLHTDSLLADTLLLMAHH